MGTESYAARDRQKLDELPAKAAIAVQLIVHGKPLDPAGSTWKGRRNKTAQDRLPASERRRVSDAQQRLAYAAQHKPTCTADWAALIIRQRKDS